MGIKNRSKRLGAQESINKHLEKMNFGTVRNQPAKWVNCRAPSCNKLVEKKHTEHGYCLACVSKARQLKAERERMAKIEREAMKCYDEDNFGLF